jgi:hypothetical protein
MPSDGPGELKMESRQKQQKNTKSKINNITKEQSTLKFS